MSPACKCVNPQAQAWVSVSDLTDAVEAINEDILLDDDDFQCRGGDQSLPTKLEVLLRGVSHTLGFEECLTVPPPELELEDCVDEDVVPASLTLAAVAGAFNVKHLPSRQVTAVHATALALVNQHSLEDTFCVVDLGTVKALYDHMVASMPRVCPHFAVKCLPDRGVISTLAALGAGFDCASAGEVELVRGLGVPASRIILAHAVKRPVDLRCIAEQGVTLTTFDSESELHKIKAARLDQVPGCAVVLRIRADDPRAKVEFGSKYGADMQAVPRLLEVAKVLGLSVAGVSFHVGSGSTSPDAYDDAISAAKHVFNQAVAIGHPPLTLLDIGGGFTSSFVGAEGAVSEFPSNFHSVAAAIDRLFPVAEYPHLRCISEPGRYFAGPAVTIAAMVYGKRESESPVASAAAPEASSQSEEVAFKYWITDGVYGNLSNIIYDWAVPEAFPLRITMAAGGGGGGGDVFATKNERRHKSTVFGPTCDSVDVVMKGVYMPELQNGDWLLFTDNGAYSRSCANDFNGIAATACRTFYVWADKMEATWSDTTRQRSLITWEKPPLELHKLWDKVWSL